MAKKFRRSACTILLIGTAAIALTACGGGSGAPSVASVGAPPTAGPTPSPSPSPSPTPTPTPTPTPAPCTQNCAPVPPPEGFVITPRNQQPNRSAHDDAEFRENYNPAEYINALFALDNGWIGQGVRIGVLDNGVKIVSELEGQVDVEASRDFNPEREGGANIGGDDSDHGTPIATIIAARNDGTGVQGLAPGATIVSLRTDLPGDSNTFNGSDNGEAIRYAGSIGLKLINMSQSREAGETVTNGWLVEAVREYARLTNGLIISSAGNDSGETANNWIDTTEDTAVNWLHVVAINADGRGYNLAGYSNQCGAAMSRCLAAPGNYEVQMADGRITRVDGTSAAAPIVTSVAAMILSKWPQLTGSQAGEILLRTARDIGDPGVDEVFGHGLVDAEAALRPINPTLSNGNTTSSLNTVMVLGNAFGGGGNLTSGTNSLITALDNVTVLDAYGRDYTGNLSGMVVQPAVANNLAMNRRVEAQMNARHAGFVSPAGSAVIGITAFDTGLRDAFGVPVLENQLTNAEIAVRLTDKVSLTGGFNSNNNIMMDIMGLAPTSDAMFAYSPLAQTSAGISHKLGKGKVTLSGYTGGQGDITVNGAILQFKQGATSVKLGMLDETGSVFGTPVGIGMMRFGDGARTYFIEAASGFDLGKWSFDGFASIGGTRLRLADDMLLSDAELITSGRFGLIASRPAFDGRLSFGLAQQLVALGGEATFTVGSGYDIDARGLLFQDRRVKMQGEIVPQFTIGYERIGERSDFRLGAASDAQGRDVRGVASWSVRFGGYR